MDEVNSAKLRDKLTNQLNGYTRWIEYQAKEASLEFAYSPRSEGILYAAVNGQPRSQERLKATGINIEESKMPLF